MNILGSQRRRIAAAPTAGSTAMVVKAALLTLFLAAYPSVVPAQKPGAVVTALAGANLPSQAPAAHPDERPAAKDGSVEPGAGDDAEAEPRAEPVDVPAAATAVDDAFIAARKAMLANDLEGYEQSILAIPRNHVLYSYVEYWRLRILLGAKRLESLTGDADVPTRAFLTRHAGTLVAELLRRDWLLALGRRADWQTFDEQYPQWQLRDETSPDCYAQLSGLSRLAPGQAPAAKARQQMHALLMRPVALNRACSELFEAAAAAGVLTRAEIRERLLFALEANALADIRFTAALLGSALNQKGVEQALRKPALALKSPQPPELLLIAVSRLARSDPEAAAAQLRLVGARLSTADRRFAWSQVAAAGMRSLAPDAHAWAKEAAGAKASDQTRGWLVRAALREQDWNLVRRLILSMSADERDDPAWIYWMGRARKAQGQAKEAAKLFASLGTRHDFYGKLANEELGRELSIPQRPPLPEPKVIAGFDANPAFARALAFYALGMRFEGNREWNYQLRSLSEPQLRAAAHWAMQRGLLDRAINADERISGDADFRLRFPTPFAEQLIPITREQGIDAAWVYGLIRQESRFIMDARSHVGASGLMQVMPATGRWIARKMGRHDFHPRELNDLQTNLEFGTFYLRQALDDLDGSAVLASAGYNAGPRRARNWRASLSRPLEGAIFAEIIPFSETRGYVKNVMSNATDYAGLFSGKPQSLKARLGVIEPKTAGTTLLP